MTCTALVLLLAAEVPPPRMDPALWRHLRAWEAAVAGTTSFVSEHGTKTDTENGPNGKTRTYDATIWHMKPNLLRVRLDRVPPPDQKPDPDDFTTYICNGRSLFEYDGGARDVNGKRTPTVTEYPLGGWFDPNGHILVQLMGGTVTARRMAQRFAIEWQQKDDPRYLILEFTPLLPRHKFEFDKLTLVLIKPDLDPPLDKLAYLPRLAKIVKPHAKVVETWDFPDPKRNPVKHDGKPISPADFKAVDPGKGWQKVKPFAPAGGGNVKIRSMLPLAW